MWFYKFIATFFGVGYIGKGAGTVAALFLCVLLHLVVKFNFYSHSLLLFFIAVVFITGVFVSGKVEKSWGKDNKRVVIDEVLGMAVTVLLLPINFFTLITGFILFRFFDIAKPLYIRRLENFKGGWGVMLDDLGAGIYSNLVLQVLVYFYYSYL
ncbi:phosphatidylglycerophosphatase A [Sphingobacteriaceae bacterium]|nr:phosphatidylglycerophosphatase A [Sphingobacteriaceae bacterium]